MKMKHSSHNTKTARFLRFRVVLLLGCVSLGNIQTSYGADTLGEKAIKVVTQKSENAARRAVYTDTAYFKDIPVEQTQLSPGQKAAAQASFKQIKGKYNTPEFNYQDNRINRLSWWDQIAAKIKGFLNSLFPNLHWNAGVTIYYVLIGIGLIALLYVVYRLTTSGKKMRFREEYEDTETPGWIEKRLTELNLETFLEQALAEKDYMLAIRYLHLINLKKLAASGQIDWHHQKTNHEFLREIKNRALSRDFARTIHIYEYVWYGRFPIGEEKYREYRQTFQELNREIA